MSWLKYGIWARSKLSQLIHSGATSCAALTMPRWEEARLRLPARPIIWNPWLIPASLFSHSPRYPMRGVRTLAARVSFGGPFGGRKGWPDIFVDETLQLD